jgi:phosphohistidine phosphatase SixA
MIYSLGVVALALTTAAGVRDRTEVPADSLIKAMRHGGYVVMMRHARTDWTTKDAAVYTNTDRSTQRNLTEQGIADAKLIGQIMKRFAIPFGEIVSSPMLRTIETAEYGFGKPTTTMALRSFEVTPEQREVVLKAPPPGTNRVLVTHHFIIERYAPGIRPGDINESEAAVLRVRDGQLELVGRFKLDDWNRLAGNQVSVSAPSPAGSAKKLLSAYIQAYNGGEGAMRKFLEGSMVENPDRPMEARLATYKTLYTDYGPVTSDATATETGNEATTKVQTKQGELTIKIVLDAGDPTKAKSVTLSRLGTGAGHR